MLQAQSVKVLYDATLDHLAALSAFASLHSHWLSLSSFSLIILFLDPLFLVLSLTLPFSVPVHSQCRLESSVWILLAMGFVHCWLCHHSDHYPEKVPPPGQLRRRRRHVSGPLWLPAHPTRLRCFHCRLVLSSVVHHLGMPLVVPNAPSLNLSLLSHSLSHCASLVLFTFARFSFAFLSDNFQRQRSTCVRTVTGAIAYLPNVDSANVLSESRPVTEPALYTPLFLLPKSVQLPVQRQMHWTVSSSVRPQ